MTGSLGKGIIMAFNSIIDLHVKNISNDLFAPFVLSIL